MKSTARISLVALTVMGFTALAGCAGDAQPASPPAPDRSSKAQPAVPETTPPDTPPKSEPITIAFGGDVHFENQVAGLLNNPRTAMDPIAEHLSRADLAMVNLETAVTSRGTPEPKNFTFRTTPTALRVLKNGGVDVVTMANNHAADYGSIGLKDTLAARKKSDIPVVGIGADSEEAFAPAEFDVKGTKVAIIGATDFYDRTATVWAADTNKAGVASALKPAKLLRAVRQASASNDVVVVYLHWGIESTNCPSGEQTTLSDQLVAAGAKVVVGSHAHRLQGSGFKDGAFVAYGLGNFVWYTQRATSGVLTVKIKDGKPIRQRFVPAFISGSGVPYPMTGYQRKTYQQNFENLRGCTDLSARP